MSTRMQGWASWSSWSPCSPCLPCRVRPTFYIILILYYFSVLSGGNMTKETKMPIPRNRDQLDHLGRPDGMSVNLAAAGPAPTYTC